MTGVEPIAAEGRDALERTDPPARPGAVVAGAWVAALLVLAGPSAAFSQAPADSLATPAAQAPADSLAAPAAPAPADSAPAPGDSAAAAGDALDRARELLRDGDYDRSIEVLKQALEDTLAAPERRRDLYLLLVKTYVFLGNDLKFRPQGREASNLNYQEAKRLIAECLGIRALRHTRPEPVADYPPEMIAFFDETRRRIFGAFRVLEVTPADAVVLLDGDTLRALPRELAADLGDAADTLGAAAGDGQMGEVNIAIGTHVVEVHARGFKSATEEITISPDVTLERSYHLTKRRGPMWYATRGVGALGVVGGVIAAIAGGGDNTATATPLPGAPGPPGD